MVDHIRKLRKVEKVSLIAWSLGGPRAGGYAAQHPEKVNRLVLFAPAYNRAAAATQPPSAPDANAFNTQSRSEFDANWDRQIGCEKQVDPAVRDVVWSEMLASDPVGAKWGSGVRRAPSTASWGWNAAMIGGMKMPTLMIAAAHDKQVPPERVKAAYDDLGATDKVLIDLGCSSHNAMWEANHLTMFNASLEWLTNGTVGGTRNGSSGVSDASTGRRRRHLVGGRMAAVGVFRFRSFWATDRLPALCDVCEPANIHAGRLRGRRRPVQPAVRPADGGRRSRPSLFEPSCVI